MSNLPWRYVVEASRLNNGMNVLFDGHHHPETTDFALNFGPGYVRLLDGTDALVIRSCLNVSGCSTPANPDVITLVRRSKSALDLVQLQSQFEKATLNHVILRPQGADEQCGVQDPRIVLDAQTSTYYMTYVAYGDWSTPPVQPPRCVHTRTKIAMSRTPTIASSWTRLNRTGERPVGPVTPRALRTRCTAPAMR